jgi:Asp/Glu/hydantoin racemase
VMDGSFTLLVNGGSFADGGLDTAWALARGLVIGALASSSASSLVFSSRFILIPNR